MCFPRVLKPTFSSFELMYCSCHLGRFVVARLMKIHGVVRSTPGVRSRLHENSIRTGSTDALVSTHRMWLERVLTGWGVL